MLNPRRAVESGPTSQANLVRSHPVTESLEGGEEVIARDGPWTSRRVLFAREYIGVPAGEFPE
ncbi:MAG: hypothetical protein JXM79_14090 [Sedimentisphaerales bacterium]|nr:hypothetical protein [Sedimentisphaerales bacterium]